MPSIFLDSISPLFVVAVKIKLTFMPLFSLPYVFSNVIFFLVNLKPHLPTFKVFSYQEKNDMECKDFKNKLI